MNNSSNDEGSEKVSEWITLKTGNYLIRVNKRNSDHFDLIQEMCKLRNNEELNSKRKIYRT